MKRGVMNHTKFKALVRLLNAREYVAVGLLESLWHLTARETPRGDIGRLSNARIALGIDWDGDPDALVHALLECGWLDADPEHRLIIHDWHQHADDTVKRYLSRNRLVFAGLDATCPDMSRLPKPMPEPKPEPSPPNPPQDTQRAADPEVTDQVGERESGQDAPDTPRSQPAPELNPDAQRRIELFGFDPLPIAEADYFNRLLGGMEWPDLKAELQAFARRGTPITEAMFRAAVAEAVASCERVTKNPPTGLKWLTTALAKAAKAPPRAPAAPSLTLPLVAVGPTSDQLREERRAYFHRLASLPPTHPDVIEAEQDEGQRIAIARTRDRLAGRLRSAAVGIGEFAGAA